ncbi:DNA polymerase IV [Herbaspirillum seropedicae]|uniref:DNA polymerase IV n=1 Tax=Herbaspirillum seropedicae (strain SmR1) TaxID=757424 RepID=D8IUR5_HERSS|nr:DNA polymerase IV [Herbaspirillum seropedicae]ADJ65797.1 nucleotidyltransferase/DNA polymerase involved in DNA repair protein [Herbaspirillum seropedicae SmR1]AKN67597.1 DNA polymerase [Herbaspirillum seropedicae]NQE29645.1 DNA polymerase [Herbaspirillum seropedicae]UMU23613.1 DNA polymerase IV [Herbaspirillum seropedicae]
MANDRRIAHLDMDAFYASVELLRYPDLRGQAVVIGGGSATRPVELPDGTRQYFRMRDYAGRGVVTTSTYEARALGVFSAMGIMKAAQLAPDAILLPTDFEAYRKYSRLFKEAVRNIAPLIEDRGIDEIYIDLSAWSDTAPEVARQIKDAVHAATSLTCSIGVAPNKMLAKISSELDKPNGLTILTPADIERRIWPLPVRKINGIGPKAAEKLSALGIDTVADLAGAAPDLLRAHFGRSYAEWLGRVAQGVDDRPVQTYSEPKSISRETTFERDLHARADRAQLSEIFTALCVKLAADLDRKGYVGRTIGIKLKYADFRGVTRDVTLPSPTGDAAAIRQAAGECLKRVPLDKKLRLLGVRVGALSKKDEQAAASHAVQAELPFAS